jgi:hypothetical protein
MSLKEMEEKDNGNGEEKLIFKPVASGDAGSRSKEVTEKRDETGAEKPVFTPTAFKDTPKHPMTEDKVIDFLSAIEGDEAARGKK